MVAEAWRHSVRHGDDFDWSGSHSANQDAHEVLPSIQTALIHINMETKRSCQLTDSLLIFRSSSLLTCKLVIS